MTAQAGWMYTTVFICGAFCPVTQVRVNAFSTLHILTSSAVATGKLPGLSATSVCVSVVAVWKCASQTGPVCLNNRFETESLSF